MEFFLKVLYDSGLLVFTEWFFLDKLRSWLLFGLFNRLHTRFLCASVHFHLETRNPVKAGQANVILCQEQRFLDSSLASGTQCKCITTVPFRALRPACMFPLASYHVVEQRNGLPRYSLTLQGAKMPTVFHIYRAHQRNY